MIAVLRSVKHPEDDKLVRVCRRGLIDDDVRQAAHRPFACARQTTGRPRFGKIAEHVERKPNPCAYDTRRCRALTCHEFLNRQEL